MPDGSDNPYEPLAIVGEVRASHRFQTTPQEGLVGVTVFMAVLHGFSATVCAIGNSFEPHVLLFGGIAGFAVVSMASFVTAVGLFMRRPLAVRASLVLFAVTALPLAVFALINAGMLVDKIEERYAVTAALSAAICSPFAAGFVFSLRLLRSIDRER